MKKDREIVLQNLKLLYVEDDEMTRKEMGKLLKRRIGQVYLAEDGKSGLKAYEEFKPDIIITDLIMPGIGGLEMLQKIRERDDDCFVMVTSALSDVDSILDTVDVGIGKYIIKPVDTDKLIGSLEEVAHKIFKKNNSEILMEQLLDKTKKKELEDQIKREFSFFIKKNTGKGPKEANVFIKGNIIEIKVYEALTAIEQSLLSDKTNGVLVNQNRKLFYLGQFKTIEELISNIVNSEVKMNNVEVNSLANLDEITLAII